MEDAPVPRELNWVEIRANCTPAKILTQLCYGVEKDINARCAFLTPKQKDDCVGFSIEKLGSDAFVVNRSGVNVVSSVQFKLAHPGIVVSNDKGQTILAASLTVSDQGRCMLSVSGVPLEHWQVRRRALESLFFDLRQNG